MFKKSTMGAFTSHHQSPEANSADGGLLSNTSTRIRKSKRLMEKFRSRQSSTRSDEISQTSTAIDLVLSHVTAQNPLEGEHSDYSSQSTADLGEL